MFGIFKKKNYSDKMQEEAKEMETDIKETNIINEKNANLSDQSFSMLIEDVFSITGRGVVVTGTVKRGQVTVGDTVTVESPNGNFSTKVNGIEMFRKKKETAVSGDNCGILVEGNQSQYQSASALTK